MTLKEIDCRGMACPQPVLAVKKSLEDGCDSLTVLVDNEAARENVRRLSLSRGCDVTVKEEKEGLYRLDIVRGACTLMEPETASGEANKERILIYIARSGMGAGDDELGLALMRAFIKTIFEFKPLPYRMVFLNGGVKLTTSGSPVLESLNDLTEMGVEILSCGTCLDFFQLKQELKVGKVTNMFEILSSLREATRVIAP